MIPGFKSSIASIGKPLYSVEYKIDNPDQAGEGELLIEGRLDSNSAPEAEEIFNPKDNCTLFAVWEAKKTTVSFNFNLGKDAGGIAIEPDNAATQSVTATYDAAMPSIKVLPQKEGKIFIGYSDKDVEKYYYNADGESQRVWDKDAKNATLYAQWQEFLHLPTIC